MRTNFLNAVFEGITLFGEETLIILLVVALWFAVDKKLAQQFFCGTIQKDLTYYFNSRIGWVGSFFTIISWRALP